MKRTISILLLLMLFFCTAGFADSTNSNTALPVEFREQNESQTRDQIETLPGITRTQNVYAEVTHIYEQVSGTPITTTTSLHVGTIKYKFYLNRNTVTNQYVGGYVVITDGYPQLSGTNGAVLTKITNPVNCVVTGNGSTYSVTISGGRFSVTYDKTITYPLSGGSPTVTRGTVDRTFRYTETGP